MKKNYKNILMVALAVVVVYFLYTSMEGFASDGSGSQPIREPSYGSGSASSEQVSMAGYIVEDTLNNIYNKVFLLKNNIIVTDCYNNRIIMESNKNKVFSNKISNKIMKYKIFFRVNINVVAANLPKSSIPKLFKDIDLFRKQFGVNVIGFILVNPLKDSDIQRMTQMSNANFLRFARRSNLTTYPEKVCK